MVLDKNEDVHEEQQLCVCVCVCVCDARNTFTSFSLTLAGGAVFFVAEVPG